MLCLWHTLSIKGIVCSISNAMVRAQLREEQWANIEAVLKSERGAGRHGRNDRTFIEAVLWWRRTGVPWRDLPDEARLRASDPLEWQPFQETPYEKELYKARSEIERTFNLLEQARRFATRYEKTLRNYASVVAIGCALLWLRI